MLNGNINRVYKAGMVTNALMGNELPKHEVVTCPYGNVIKGVHHCPTSGSGPGDTVM